MIRAIMIVEMAGRPAKHLTESLEKHIGILNKVKDIKVHSIKVSEPREIERGDLPEGTPKEDIMFTAFAEADFECENFGRLSETMFDFMPSSVEVIEPPRVSMDTNEATSLLNNISGRIHRYDELAKITEAKFYQIGTRLQEMQKALMERDIKISELTQNISKVKSKKVRSKQK